VAKAIITHGGHSDRVEPPSFRLQLFVPLASSKADCALASLNAASKAASGRPPLRLGQGCPVETACAQPEDHECQKAYELRPTGQ
jgi:hypothetical protein